MSTFLVLLFFSPPSLWMTSAHALSPEEVLIVANRDSGPGLELARYYRQRRGIPEGNLLVLGLPDRDSLTESEFRRDLLLPVRSFIERRNQEWPPISCILFMYGVPLKVAAPAMTKGEKDEAERLKARQRYLDAISAKGSGHGDIGQELDAIRRRIGVLEKKDYGASVDSEMALALEPFHSRSAWIPNPLFLGNRGKTVEGMPVRVLMTARLDGPSPEVVRRIIDDSIAVEREGLSGTTCLDARWPRGGRGKDGKSDAYRVFDGWIHAAADVLASRGFPVILDAQERLFQPGECPDPALYCGWYSLGKYVDAFQWRRGAVAYHIASAECASLRGSMRALWCPSLLEDGVAATIGPANEPYLQAFPRPDIFFALLVDGHLALAECYALSTPFVSWQMVLVGDPLYRPFRVFSNRKEPSGFQK